MTRIAAIFILASLPVGLTSPASQAQDLAPDTAASGECELTLSGDTSIQWDGPYSRGYDVYDSLLAYEPLPIVVQHRGSACRFFVTATPVSSGARPVLINNGSALMYDLQRGTNGPSIVSASFEGTPSTRIEGAFPAGDTASPITLSFQVPPLQFVQSGQYGGQIVLRAYRERDNSWELADEWPVDIIVQVPAQLRISGDDFADTARSASIDLGELSTGVRRDIGFDVRSNSPVRVSILSANEGTLAHRLADIAIPYSLRRGGTPVSLSGPGDAFQLGVSRAGTALPLQIEVAPGSYPAGAYSDVLTVTFTAE